MRDGEIRKLWREAGGDFHGPNVETGTMPEEKLFPFLRSLLAERASPWRYPPERPEKGRGYYVKSSVTDTISDIAGGVSFEPAWQYVQCWAYADELLPLPPCEEA